MAMTQDINTATVAQNYPIGMRHAVDERVFRYACVRNTATLRGRLAANLSTNEETGVAGANSAVGSYSVTIVVVAAGGIAVNELEGGYLTYKNTGFYTHRIRSNTAAAFGADCVLTLETPLVENGIVDLTTVLNVFHNPWYNVGSAAAVQGYAAYVGMPYTTIAATPLYTWLQTWGPCNCCESALYGGPNERQAWAISDGAIGTYLDPSSLENIATQHVGFWLPMTYWSAANHKMVDGGHLLWLEIAS